MNTWRKIALAGLLLAAAHAHAEDIVHYYYTDPQGTVLAKTDAAGNVIASYDYAPYGSQALGTPPASGPTGYTGHVNDPDTGLVYMQHRYYDPSTGRFLNADPVGPNVGNTFNFNRYDYANNNPYKFTDPDGRYSCSGSKEQCGMVSAALTKIGDAATKLGAGSKGQKALNAVTKLFGKEGQKNGVSVKFSNKGFASTDSDGNKITITFNSTAMHNAFSGRSDGSQESVENGGTVAHEGQHGVDDRARRRGPESRAELIHTERNAYRTQSYVNQGEGIPSAYGVWSPGINDASRTQAINQSAAGSVAADCAGGVCK